MRFKLADKLVVPVGNAVSQAIEMTGANAVAVDIVVESYSGLELDVSLQIGNDLAGWTTLSTLPVNAAGAAMMKVSGIAGRYARLQYFLDGSPGDKVILSAEIETKKL